MLSHFQTQLKATPKPSFTPVRSGILQRCTATTECDDCRNQSLGLQRSSVNHAEPSSVPPIVHEVLRSPGQPLDATTRAFMEPRFGHDFSQVQVHTDAQAAESARAVSALAYTVGRDVVFGAGRYAPHTNAGSQLIAHELTHVVQQHDSNHKLNRLEIGAPNDRCEQEADQIMGQITRGGLVTAQSGFLLQRKIGDGHDLTARRFAKNHVLEAVFDNEQLLQNGDTGTAVRLIQGSLLAQGYSLPVHGADGIFGAETEAAVRQFQIDTGAVKLDGIVGPETMQLLDMHDPGTTRATGPRAAKRPTGAPALPAATAVVFSEDPAEPFAGYDDSVAPNWLVVPTHERRRAAAAITPAKARPAITSLNTAIATVEPTPNGVVVTGVARGATVIQAQEGGAILDRLRVSVKDRLDRSVAFHYVCDSPPGPAIGPPPPPHCSNGTPSANEMRSLLNRVWERQANVRFTDGGSANVVAPGDLGAAVDWTSPAGGEWNTVTALGMGANYNVFRVWHYLQNGAEVNDAANLGVNTLIGDHPCADGLGLAHETGHFLGLNHDAGFIMTPCGGRVNRRVSKAMVDLVNP